MKKKSLIVLALALVMVLSIALVACSNGVQVPASNIEVQEFSRGAQLSSVKLPEGFAWKNAETPLKVGKNEYPATYTDGKNTVEVFLTVEMKMTASMEQEEVSMDYLERTLASDAFKEGGDMYASTAYDQYVMILARSARGIKASIKDAYMDRVKKVVLPLVDPATNVANNRAVYLDYTTNTVMTLIALGESTVVEGVDLAAPFYSKEVIFDAFANNYTYINSLNIIKNLNIPETYTTKDGNTHTSDMTVEIALAKLLDSQVATGGWEADMYNEDFSEIIGKTTDFDANSMALTSIAEFKDQEAVKTTIDKLVAILKADQDVSGGIMSFGFANPTTTATTMAGFVAVGIDPSTVKASAEGSVDMLTFMTNNRINEGDNKGAYGSATYLDTFTTKDALIALINYNRYLKCQPNFYDVK